MDDGPGYFSLADDAHWTGIPLDRALEWTRVFLRWQPSVPGSVIWMVRPNLEKGVPAGFTDWATRASTAESIGFTPSSYEMLQEALDELDPDAFPQHPDNHLVKNGIKAVRPFDAERWRSWCRFVDDGLDAVTATSLLLSAES